MTYLNSRRYVFILVLALVGCQSIAPTKPPEPGLEFAASETNSGLAVDQNKAQYIALLKKLKTDSDQSVISALATLANSAPKLAFIWTNLGIAYSKSNNYERAETAFLYAISLNNRDAIAHNQLGILRRISGQFDEAKLAYQTAIEIDDQYALAYLNLGILFDIYLQKLDLALEHYQKYQTLTLNQNKTVSTWIVDIKRRLKAQ